MIKVYGKENCTQCNFTKKQLDNMGVEYEYIDSTGNQEIIDYIINELGFRQLPVVVSDKLEPFSGFQPAKLKQLK